MKMVTIETYMNLNLRQLNQLNPCPLQIYKRGLFTYRSLFFVFCSCKSFIIQKKQDEKLSLVYLLVDHEGREH